MRLRQPIDARLPVVAIGGGRDQQVTRRDEFVGKRLMPKHLGGLDLYSAPSRGPTPHDRWRRKRNENATSELSRGGTSRPPVIGFSEMASACVFGMHHPDGGSFGSAQSAPQSYFRLSSIARLRSIAQDRAKTA